MASVHAMPRLVESYLDVETGKEYLRAEPADLFSAERPEAERRGVLAGHDSSDEIPILDVWGDWGSDPIAD